MANIYINKDSGDNATGDGSSGSPYETLAHAFDQSSADDTIICQDSTATYDFVNDTFNHNITIQGESDDASGAVFDGGGSNVQWTLGDGAVIVFKKIKWQNASLSYRFFITNDNDVVDLTCENCIFKNFGIRNQPGGNYGLIGRAISGDISFTNCLFNNVGSGAVDYPKMVYGRPSAGLTLNVNFTGCSIYYNSRACVAIMEGNSGGTINLIIKNTIIGNDSGDTVTIETGSNIGSTVSYSCLYNVTDNSNTSTANITSDPLFVDTTNDDFRLRPSSPAIDTGTLI